MNENIDLKKAISLAGGALNISVACNNRGMAISPVLLNTWKYRNKLPTSEWTGKSCVAGVICDLIRALGHDDVNPLDLCPGAGQYMNQAPFEDVDHAA